jgi:hypothetical protein
MILHDTAVDCRILQDARLAKVMTVPDQNISLGFVKKIAIRDAAVVMYDTACDCHDETI